MGNNASSVLEVAKGELGYSRWTDPQTGTKYGRWYAQITGVSYYGQNGVPYCAMFVSWVFNRAGAKCVGLPAAYCPYIVRDARNAGKAVSARNAQPGDLVLFDWAGDGVADHVGIVESNTGSSIRTIEGNTDNGIVARKNRPYSSVCCVVRPSFASNVYAPPGIIQCAPNRTEEQLWRFVEVDGYYKVECKSGKVLDVKGGTQEPLANGRIVQAYHDNGTDAQRWRKVDGIGGGFRLVSKLDPTYCLDVVNGTVGARKNITLHKLQSADASKWAQSFITLPDYRGGEWVSIVNCKSGYVIDANPNGYNYS